MKTPDYVLSEDVTWWEGQELKTLKAGLFVRPIDWPYVPKHVIEDSRFRYVSKDSQIFCYTRHGIVPIPISAFRRV